MDLAPFVLDDLVIFAARNADDITVALTRFQDEFIEISDIRALDNFCSFTGNTPVLMANGTTKPISEINIGDMVLAEDPETGEQGPRRVLSVSSHQDQVLSLDVGGSVISTTEDHPFWNATDQQWQRADALDPGELLQTAAGDLVEVGQLDQTSLATTTAYNLTVHDIHTYYVVAGTSSILVHNNCFQWTFDGPDHVVSPAGLRYGPDPNPQIGHRTTHVLRHIRADGPDHTVFNVNTSDSLYSLLDEAWALRGTTSPNGGSPNDLYIVDMSPRVVGTNGEQYIYIVVEPGTSDVVTSFPSSTGP